MKLTKTFATTVAKALAKEIELPVEVRESVTDNGIKFFSLVVGRKDVHVAMPSMRLIEADVAQIETTEEKEQFIQAFVAHVKRVLDDGAYSTSFQIAPAVKDFQFEDFDKIKPFLRAYIVNAKKNKQFALKAIEDLDLAYAFYIDVSEIFQNIDPESGARVRITPQMIDMWEITIDEIMEPAIAQTIEARPLSISNIGCILSAMMGFPFASDLNVDVIGYGANYGAIQMFYPGLQDILSKKFGTREIVLVPSSVHEILALPLSNDGTIDRTTAELAGIVKEVNQTAVAPEDYLSDNLYTFDKNGKVVMLK